MTSPEPRSPAFDTVTRAGGDATSAEARRSEDEQFWAPLTDLPSRAAILETLEEARQSGKRALRLN